MRTFCPRLLLVAAALLVAIGSVQAAPAKPKGKPDSATAAALKKVTDRYALTKARIATLLDQRMNPTPLPALLPNPFYRSPPIPLSDTAPVKPADAEVVPAAPDSSDADTLARFAATLKVSGLVVLNGQPHLTINQTICKAGDVIPVGNKDHPIYVQVLRITPDDVTFGLNQAEQTVRLKK